MCKNYQNLPILGQSEFLNILGKIQIINDLLLFSYFKTYTVDVRNPDVRFSAFSKSVRLLNRPDFRLYLKSGRFRPVIGRSVHSPYTCPVIGRPIPTQTTQNLFQTCSKPVWNSLTSEIRTILSGFQTFGSLTERPDFECV